MAAMDLQLQRFGLSDFGRLDRWMLINIVALLCFSVVMVYSATVVVDQHGGGQGFTRAHKHGVFVLLGLVVMFVVAHIPVSFWQRGCRYFMAAGVLALAVILIPGVGHEVNGSTRWFAVGSLRIQPSEFMKFFMIIYMADYLTQYREQLKTVRYGIANIAAVVGLVGGLLLLEPDMGTTVVIAATVFCMMYLSGVRITHMLMCVAVAGIAFYLLVVLSPYRLDRWMSYQDPWADPWKSGFQLTQALIAFGRGEWFGLGLGQSIQKLFYLPHAANDFLAAVVAEELGFAGILALLGLYGALLWRGFAIAARAERDGHDFHARIVHGVIILISLQAIVNLGVNMGVLPTKGLTLPLMSYGGSSIVVTLALVGLVFAVDRDIRKPAGKRKR